MSCIAIFVLESEGLAVRVSGRYAYERPLARSNILLKFLALVHARWFLYSFDVDVATGFAIHLKVIKL